MISLRKPSRQSLIKKKEDSDPNLFAQEVRNCAGGTVTLGLWSAKVIFLSALLIVSISSTNALLLARANGHAPCTFPSPQKTPPWAYPSNTRPSPPSQQSGTSSTSPPTPQLTSPASSPTATTSSVLPRESYTAKQALVSW